jgi:hypothetical protein
VGERIAKFDKVSSLENIALDVVEGLEGFTLATKVRKGVERFALRRPDGKILEPMDADRRVCVMIGGKTKYFNVANLLASSILKDDVTDNEFGMLIDKDGIWVESAADRLALCERLKIECPKLERVDLTHIPRPKSDDLDVTGKGYYVEGGIVYKANGNPISVKKTGHIFLTGADGERAGVGLGWILFAAYPDFYGYVPGLHTEMDHINGISTDNEAWNFRPMTAHQNAAVRHRTGDRSKRPAPDSSHEKFKRDATNELTDVNIEKWIAGGKLKRYADTPYWLHRDGAVLRKLASNSFVYAELFVQRDEYTYAGKGGKVHVMMMKTFGEYEDGKVVMHEDDYKENNCIDNLKMGTKEENAAGKKAVTIHIKDADETVTVTTYESESDAARATGIALATINQNRNRQQPGSPLFYSTTRDGKEFAATDPLPTVEPVQCN